jgi:acetolactate synthase-1/2/3 large subunit
MLAVGTRFAEICTGSYGAVPPANLIHIDINPDAIGANHETPIGICADARDAVPALAETICSRRRLDKVADRDRQGGLQR